MSSKSKKRTPQAKPAVEPDDAAVIIAVEKWRSIASMVRTLILGLCIPSSILATWPVASVLAGKSTEVNVTVAITLTIALTISTGGSLAWGNQQRKKAAHARSRVTELERRVIRLEEENAHLPSSTQPTTRPK